MTDDVAEVVLDEQDGVGERRLDGLLHRVPRLVRLVAVWSRQIMHSAV